MDANTVKQTSFQVVASKDLFSLLFSKPNTLWALPSLEGETNFLDVNKAQSVAELYRNNEVEVNPYFTAKDLLKLDKQIISVVETTSIIKLINHKQKTY